MTVKRIDAHAHLTAGDDRFLRFLDERGLRLHNVSVAAAHRQQWDAEGGRTSVMRRLHREHPEYFAWCTTFDLPRFDDPDYMPGVIEQLEQHFEEGATGCKLWRSIGMQWRKPSGEFIMMDDPLFDPLYDYLVSVGKPLLVHICEPYERWPEGREALAGRQVRGYSPLRDEETGGGECPGYWAQIQARDNVLERHPDLKVVGAHLGSLEHDVTEIAKRLDRYPNFAVDTSARRTCLACQDSAVVRRFMIDYQDRILWGMDALTRETNYEDFTDAQKDAFYRMLTDGYSYEFAYYESRGRVMVDHIETDGLDLPPEVLEKIYLKNALTWFPDMFAK